jgi:hypothetical protein
VVSWKDFKTDKEGFGLSLALKSLVTGHARYRNRMKDARLLLQLAYRFAPIEMRQGGCHLLEQFGVLKTLRFNQTAARKQLEILD